MNFNIKILCLLYFLTELHSGLIKTCFGQPGSTQYFAYFLIICLKKHMPKPFQRNGYKKSFLVVLVKTDFLKNNNQSSSSTEVVHSSKACLE